MLTITRRSREQAKRNKKEQAAALDDLPESVDFTPFKETAPAPPHSGHSKAAKKQSPDKHDAALSKHGGARIHSRHILQHLSSGPPHPPTHTHTHTHPLNTTHHTQRHNASANLYPNSPDSGHRRAAYARAREVGALGEGGEATHCLCRRRPAHQDITHCNEAEVP